MDATVARLKRYLREAEATVPQLWRRVADLRAQRGRALPLWPEGCYLPLSASVALLSTVFGDPLPLTHAPLIALLGALIAWRPTQGIYRFDATVWAELWEAPLADLPREVFHHLPEWCCYLEVPPAARAQVGADGAFVFLEWDSQTGEWEVRVVLDHLQRLLPLPAVLLTYPTVAEALAALIQRHLPAQGVGRALGQAAADAVLLPHWLAVTVYLCARNADLGRYGRPDRPTRPQGQRSHRGERVIPPPDPRIWEVGYRVGAALRRARQSTPRVPTGGSHAAPVPHLRRAHWHLYWTGPRTGPRTPIVHWLAPILVGRQHGEPVPTIHPVPPDA